MNRRGFLRIAARVPVVGPLMAQQMSAAGISALGLTASSGPGGAPMSDVAGALGMANACPAPSAWSPESEDIKAAAIKAAIRNIPGVRAEIEGLIYEDCRQVSYLDPDLAANRSFSLAAKVCYQRQRNVERNLQYGILNDSPWRRLQKIGNRLAKFVGA